MFYFDNDNCYAIVSSIFMIKWHFYVCYVATINPSTDILMEKDLEILLKNNRSLKVQFSVVTCTGMPKTGKTSFSHLLMKSQPKDTTDYSGDHSTIYIKRKNNISKECVKWEKIKLNELIDQLKKYIHNGKDKITSVDMDQKTELEEIWSILIVLDISVPTSTITLLPLSIITFVTCDLCDRKEQTIESEEFSCFLDALMSCNCFKTNPEQNHMFDKLVEGKPKNEKRCYTAFVGVYKSDSPKSVVTSVNEKLKNLHTKLSYIRSGYPEQIPYPYWFVEGGHFLNSVDIANPNDPVAGNLYTQMEKRLPESIYYNVPITWLLLFLNIVKMCEDKEFVHYETIFNSVWMTMCKNKDEKELKTALSFFHSQDALLYFKDIDGICNYVFKDIRWLFKKITYLLYQLPPTYTDYDAYNTFKFKGIINQQMITEVNYEWNMEDDIQFSDFLNLLVHKKFIFSLNRSENIEYFIPSALKSFDSKSEGLSRFAKLKIQEDSLLIAFKCGSLHRLLFCQLAAYLLKNLPSNWSHPGPNDNNVQNIFSNLITFSVDNFGYVSFIDRIHFLEIQIHSSSHEEEGLNEQHLAYRYANDAINNACAELHLNHMHNNNKIIFGFLCQSCSYTENHIMIMDKSSSVAYCCIRNKRITLLESHLKWINEVK